MGAAGADALLADGLLDLEFIRELRSRVQKPLVFNQMAGGKSPHCNLSTLHELGVALVIYSTPCLFPVQTAIEDSMQSLLEGDGDLRAIHRRNTGVEESIGILQENLARRGSG